MLLQLQLLRRRRLLVLLREREWREEERQGAGGERGIRELAWYDARK
jgi:hypothetical protein